ncbi:MAG: gamma-glutamylcyclotransferase [Nostocaceae cyanobacterium]|nr:gamma-glutamylcyclotransferase [Nostocaceae cyanobacterium]
MVKVFVYGTLKPGEAYYQQYCAGKVISAKRAIAYGELFALPQGYPAMTAGNSPIHGYLLEFSDIAVLRELDELEDYSPSRQISQNLYNRQEIEIFDLEGESLGLAWIYLMTKALVTNLQGVSQTDAWWTGVS